MRMADYVFSIFTSVLKSKNEAKDDVFKALLENPNLRQLNFQNPRTPNIRSLGVITSSNEAVGFLDWAKKLMEKPLEVRIVGPEDLPENWDEGRNSGRNIIAITIDGKTTHYAFNFERGRDQAISASQFLKMLDASPMRDAIRKIVIEEVTELNRQNARTVVTAGNIDEYLKTAEGENSFEFELSQILGKMRDLSETTGQAFVVPEDYKKYFDERIPDEFDNPPPRTFDVAYPFTALQIITFADAQKDKTAIWSSLATMMNQCEFDPKGKKDFTAGDIKAYFENVSEDDFGYIMPGNIVSAIEDGLRETGTRVVIPDEFKEMVTLVPPPGPKSKMPLLEPLNNPEPYEFYYLQETKVRPTPPKTKLNPEELTKSYLEALHKIEAYAKKVESPFFEAFKLGSFVLEAKDILQTISNESCDACVAAAEKAGFSENARRVLDDSLTTLMSFSSFHWSDLKSRILVSTAIADVFGGMGSWNDQYFSQDQEFEEVTEGVSKTLYPMITVMMNLS